MGSGGVDMISRPSLARRPRSFLDQFSEHFRRSDRLGLLPNALTFHPSSARGNLGIIFSLALSSG